MEKPGKRGKIPQQDWPSIITRYESGETLASIARTYDCSPPAISYIVSRSRARGAAAAPVMPAPGEPQLVKAHAVETAQRDAIPAILKQGDSFFDAAARTGAEPADQVRPVPAPRPNPDDAMFSSDSHRGSKGQGDSGFAERYRQGRRDPSNDHANAPRAPSHAGASAPNGEARRTLHLTLPQAESAQRTESAPPTMTHGIGFGSAGERQANRPGGDPSGLPQPSRHSPGQLPPRPENRNANEGARAKEGAFIDQALRERVDGDIAAFLTAFDAALDHDTLESRAELREATDRLLRAGARTRIELERLEARLPLTSRDKSAQNSPALRPR